MKTFSKYLADAQVFVLQVTSRSFHSVKHPFCVLSHVWKTLICFLATTYFLNANEIVFGLFISNCHSVTLHYFFVNYCNLIECCQIGLKKRI